MCPAPTAIKEALTPMGYTYCISDIHGELDRLLALLLQIQFQPEDRLYILGDVIDRGPQGLEALALILDTPNITLLRGNHEQMCLDTLGHNPRFGTKALWRENGGHRTYRDLLYRTPPAQRRRLLQALAQTPDHLELTVNHRPFYLVHGYPSHDPHTRLWGRPQPGQPAPIPGVTCIVGHTPTCFLHGKYEHPLDIWHGEGIVDIDCGCGHPSQLRRLACLRLEDFAAFYV